MPSTLTWLDHDPAQRERVNRMLALFDEPFTVDQLGLGGIRDAFADRLFPGTSTIQTLPEVPPDWPEPKTLELRRDEAEFLRGRILPEHPRTLLALLARGGVETDVEFPWQHPSYASFSDLHKLELRHARLFSEMKHGAALVYNLALAYAKGVDAYIERYRRELEEWQAGLDVPAVQAWPLAELWELTLNQGHTITPQTRRFVEQWVGYVRQERPLTTDREARELVRLRETRLKGPRSKFMRGALETWQGETGVGRLTYRWPYVQSHLNDLYRGLARG